MREIKKKKKKKWGGGTLKGSESGLKPTDPLRMTSGRQAQHVVRNSAARWDGGEVDAKNEHQRFYLRLHGIAHRALTHSWKLPSFLCARTCMDLQTAALAVQQGRGAIVLQQRVSGSWGAVLLPEREADLRDQGLGPSETGTCGGLHQRWKTRCVRGFSSRIVLCFVFGLKKKKKPNNSIDSLYSGTAEWVTPGSQLDTDIGSDMLCNKTTISCGESMWPSLPVGLLITFSTVFFFKAIWPWLERASCSQTGEAGASTVGESNPGRCCRDQVSYATCQVSTVLTRPE